MSEVKQKKCKNPSCGQKFTPKMTTQKVCSYKCAVNIARINGEAKKAKEVRKYTAEAKKRLKTRSDWIKDAQKIVNEYVRIRDQKRPCISCGEVGNGLSNYFDAGHYRSRGSAPHLRFYTLNIWKQCKRCNLQLSGNIVEYRKGLIDILGSDKVELIESMNNELKPDIEYLQRLIKVFRKKIRLYRKLFR